jgi:hypothetical protein
MSYNVNRVDTELAGYGWFSATDHVVDFFRARKFCQEIDEVQLTEEQVGRF